MSIKLIVGAGRQAAETYYLIEDLGFANDIVCFADDKADEIRSFLNRDVYTINHVIDKYQQAKSKPEVLVAVGDVEINKRLVKKFTDAGFSFFNAIDKSINTKRQKQIGAGVIIAQGSVLTCNISIGNHVIVNIGCTISHDCVIGNHVNISPGSHLAGRVEIEDDVFVGTGATFIPKVKVGKGSVVAAGACVTNNVPPFSMVAGVPAIIKKQLQP